MSHLSHFLSRRGRQGGDRRRGRGRGGVAAQGRASQHRRGGDVPRHYFSNTLQLKSIDYRLRKQREKAPDTKLLFKTQHEARHFVLACLLEHDEPTSIVFALDNYSETVGDLLEQPFSLHAGFRRNEWSFQRVAVPLMKLVNDPRVQQSPLISRRDSILRLFTKDDFWERVLCLLEQGAAIPHSFPEADLVAPDAWNPTSWNDVLEPVLVLLRCIVRTFVQRCSLEQVPTWTEKLARAVVAFRAHEDRTISRHLKYLQETVDQAFKGDDSKRETDRKDNIELYHQNEAQRMQLAQMGVTDSVEQDDVHLPGKLRPNGPRHSNDFEDFRRIQVVPTQEELDSPLKPYLPRTYPEGSPHVANHIDRFLDIQFRLMREDMFAVVRRGIRAFLDESVLEKTKKKGTGRVIVGRVESRAASDREADRMEAVRLFVCRRVRVGDFSSSFRAPFCVKLSFDPVPLSTEVQQMYKGQQAKESQGNDIPRVVREYFDKGGGKKVVPRGALAVLIFNASDRHRCSIFCGTIEDRSTLAPHVVGEPSKDKRSRVEKCSSVTWALLDQVMLKPFVEALCKHGPSGGDRCEHVLVTVVGHFFTTAEAILQGLQKLNQGALPFPFHESLVPQPAFYARDADVHAAYPATRDSTFAEQGARWDLRCILAQSVDERTRNRFEQFPVTGFKQLRDALLEVDTVFDATQTIAFAAGVTKQVALIQGPPGTGKSYVGVRIVKAILENAVNAAAWEKNIDEGGALIRVGPAQLQRNKINALPILCVCFTNHALDQFLEDLVGTGVKLDSVVRVGGRSKSTKLETRNLRQLKLGTRLPSSTYFQLKDVQRDASEVETQLQGVVESLRSTEMLNWPAIEPFLRQFFPWIHAQFFLGWHLQTIDDRAKIEEALDDIRESLDGPKNLRFS